MLADAVHKSGRLWERARGVDRMPRACRRIVSLTILAGSQAGPRGKKIKSPVVLIGRWGGWAVVK
jgi:hypothetical protein